MPVVMMIAAASAAAMTAPVPLEQLAGAGLYTDGAVKRGKAAGVLYRVLIDPQGKVVSCQMTDSVGDAALAAAVCPSVTKKRFAPATDSQGRPAFGAYSGAINLHIPGDVTLPGMPVKPGANLVLTVSAVPGGMPMDVPVLAEIGAGGAVTACNSLTEPRYARLANVACEQLAASPMPIDRDASGAAVARVERLIVRFTTLAGSAGTAGTAASRSPQSRSACNAATLPAATACGPASSEAWPGVVPGSVPPPAGPR